MKNERWGVVCTTMKAEVLDTKCKVQIGKDEVSNVTFEILTVFCEV